jgi:hypothetical protein
MHLRDVAAALILDSATGDIEAAPRMKIAMKHGVSQALVICLTTAALQHLFAIFGQFSFWIEVDLNTLLVRCDNCYFVTRHFIFFPNLFD